MKLIERYADLAIPLTLFGKTYHAPITVMSIESLKEYAERCINSKIPALVSIGFEMNRNICSANNNLNGVIS